MRRKRVRPSTGPAVATRGQRRDLAGRGPRDEAAKPDLSHRSHRLADGRSLGFAEYGEHGGFPVLFFHGTPGSRLDASPLTGAAATAGVRLLALDRPGMGLSDPAPERTIPDWADDVGAFAEAQGLERFSVLGYSSGGPYALAVAAATGAAGERSRLYGCGVVSGNSPVDDPEVSRTLPVDSKVFNYVARWRPRLAARGTDMMLRVARRPAAWWPRPIARAFALQYSQSDREVLAAMSHAHPPESGMDGFVEAVRQGGGGVATDMLLEIGDWGFDLEEVTLDVQLWYGSADPMVPLVQGELLAKRLPHSELHVVDGGGHLVLFDRTADILAALVPEAL